MKKTATFYWLTAILIGGFWGLAFPQSSQALDTPSNPFIFVSGLSSTDRLNSRDNLSETTTTTETTEETTQEDQAPLPPITFDPSLTTTSIDQSDNYTVEPTSSTEDTGETIESTQTTLVTEKDTNKSNSTHSQRPKSNNHYEPGKLFVIKKDNLPHEVIVHHLISQLSAQPNLLKNVFYQLTFWTTQFLIHPDPHLYLIANYPLAIWLAIFAEQALIPTIN